MALNNPNSLPLGGSFDDAVSKSARAKYDRRNRTLPHPKHGPYTCPRCEGLFTTSQLFAAHMRSHYKSESEEERRMRQEEKHRRRGNHQGPASAAAQPMVMAVQPTQVRKLRLKALSRNVPMPVQTESVELQEVEVEMEVNGDVEMETEDVHSIGSAPGIMEAKEEPVM